MRTSSLFSFLGALAVLTAACATIIGCDDGGVVGRSDADAASVDGGKDIKNDIGDVAPRCKTKLDADKIICKLNDVQPLYGDRLWFVGGSAGATVPGAMIGYNQRDYNAIGWAEDDGSFWRLFPVSDSNIINVTSFTKACDLVSVDVVCE